MFVGQDTDLGFILTAVIRQQVQNRFQYQTQLCWCSPYTVPKEE